MVHKSVEGTVDPEFEAHGKYFPRKRNLGFEFPRKWFGKLIFNLGFPVRGMVNKPGVWRWAISQVRLKVGIGGSLASVRCRCC